MLKPREGARLFDTLVDPTTGKEYHNSTSGVLPGRHQTVFRAELYAVVRALEATDGDLTVATDCKGVVVAAQGILGSSARLSPKRNHLDLWWRLRKAAEGRIIQLRWAPSHKDEDAVAQGLLSAEDREGNARAGTAPIKRHTSPYPPASPPPTPPSPHQ